MNAMISLPHIVKGNENIAFIMRNERINQSRRPTSRIW